MRRRATGIWVAVVVVVALLVGGASWRHVEAFATKRTRGPDQTYPAAPISTSDPLLARLAAAGDVGTGGQQEYATATAMDLLDRDHEFDALLLLGDNVYENGDPDDVEAKVLRPFSAVLDNGTLLLAALGNHDVRNGNGPGQAAALGMPDLYYATEIDGVLIVALDSNRTDDPDQLAWLDATLATRAARWTIVILHHPPYSGGWHGSHIGVREHFVPLFEQHDVDLVLSGHEHDYQRMHPIGGVTYVITGAAAKLRPTDRADFAAAAWSTHSFVDLAIYRDRIEGQAVDHAGRAFDSFTLRR